MNSAGTLTDSWTYWPYGEVRTRTGTTVTPFTFVGTLGYFQDLLSKLLYVRARFLRVYLARWLTVDPLWPSEPAYPYVMCAPTLNFDPTGLSVSMCIGSPLEDCQQECAEYGMISCVIEMINLGLIVLGIIYCQCYEYPFPKPRPKPRPKPLPGPPKRLGPPYINTTNLGRGACIGACYGAALLFSGFDLDTCLRGCG